jgi:hypothetical protein
MRAALGPSLERAQAGVDRGGAAAAQVRVTRALEGTQAAAGPPA